MPFIDAGQALRVVDIGLAGDPEQLVGVPEGALHVLGQREYQSGEGLLGRLHRIALGVAVEPVQQYMRPDERGQRHQHQGTGGNCPPVDSVAIRAR